MVKMIALRPHQYGNRRIQVGEEYLVHPRHALALEAAKASKRVTAIIETTVALPEKRRYKRRDLKAEE